MLNQGEQASNQYGFYAVPKALEPKKKYRQTYEYQERQSKYSDEQAQQQQNQFQTIERERQNQKEIERDFYVDEAPYPQFKPKQRGLDYGVQIQRQDLFDFDMEVQPLVEILVGRSVVSAINQLQEDKQEGEREKQLDQYQKKRNAELMQTQRMQTKHNRKQDEAKRRVLQKQTFVKKKKIATEKLIARRNAKHGLLNLRNEVLGQLQEEGYLRQSTYLSLRVQYESWLYEQIKSIVNQRRKIQQSAQNIIKQKQKQVKSQHQKNIEKQNKRKKDILDERERIRKENEERKLKKKIRKQRLNLNAERAARFNQAGQLVSKYQPLQKVLKAESISNGLTKRRNAPTTVHVTGGLLNYVVALINSSGGQHSAHQIQTVLQKLLSELSAKLQVQISAAHMSKIQQLKAKMQADPIQFMKNKESLVKELVEKISLEISVLQATGVSIKSKLHSSIIEALMNIYLNCLPAPKMEGDETVSSYDANQRDKKRQQLKNKIQLNPVDSTSIEQIKKTENVVRVRFQKIRPEKTQEQSEPKVEGEQKKVDLDEWIDIYDGEGWERQKKQQLKEAPREGQQAATYSLTGFDNTFIVDQRTLYFLQSQLQKLLGIQGGEDMVRYRDRLEHINNKDDKVPIYDVQLKWE